MDITPKWVIKRRETMIAKYGSHEAYIAAMRAIGAKGGSKEAHGDKPRGFARDPESSQKALAKRWKK
jgi:hypothetical protein